MKEPKISKRRVLAKKLKNFFKPAPKKLTLMEMVSKINKENHFTEFDDNLVSEIYTALLDYGTPKVEKIETYKYYISLYEEFNDVGKIVTEFEVTENGLLFKEY